ncbi:MAG: hypothetical protein K8I00_05795, partial [Candidatus Omnitrophica bacterium]|nr:hypothetical protein [Candidatus Omnitrophota bacterium]
HGCQNVHGRQFCGARASGLQVCAVSFGEKIGVGIRRKGSESWYEVGFGTEFAAIPYRCTKIPVCIPLNRH